MSHLLTSDHVVKGVVCDHYVHSSAEEADCGTIDVRIPRNDCLPLPSANHRGETSPEVQFWQADLSAYGMTVTLLLLPINDTGSGSWRTSFLPPELATCISRPSAGPDTTAKPAVLQFVTSRAAFGAIFAKAVLRVTSGEATLPVTPPKYAPIPPSDVKDSNLSEYARAVNNMFVAFGISRRTTS